MLKLSLERALAALSFGSAVFACSAGWSAETRRDPALGTVSSPTVDRVQAASMANRRVGSVAAASAYTGAQFATGSVALRNRAGGLLTIGGVAAPVRAAFLYWAVIDNGDPLPSERIVTLTPSSLGDPVRLRGVPVGVGPSPCWGGTQIYVYRAAVPPRAITGSGTYRVTLTEGSYGSASGADPWVETPSYPLWDGATLVVIGRGTSRVSIFDSGLAGNTFTGSFSYTLPLSGTAGSSVLFDNIAADGQIGRSRTPLPGVPGKTTTINGVTVAGPGSTAGDSDYDGRVGAPLPQLWDDAARDVSSVAAGASSLNVAVGNAGDCATPVANIVQY